MKKSPYLKHNTKKILFSLIKYNSKHSLPVDSYINKLARIDAIKLVNNRYNRVRRDACLKYIIRDNRVINHVKKTKNLIKLLEFIGDNTTFIINKV